MKNRNTITAVICAAAIIGVSAFGVTAGSESLSFNSQGVITFDNGTPETTDDVVFDASDFTSIGQVVTDGKKMVVGEIKDGSDAAKTYFQNIENSGVSVPSFAQIAEGINIIKNGSADQIAALPDKGTDIEGNDINLSWSTAGSNDIRLGKYALVNGNLVAGALKEGKNISFTNFTSTSSTTYNIPDGIYENKTIDVSGVWKGALSYAKKGTAVPANVLEDKTFTNSTTIGATGTMKDFNGYTVEINPSSTGTALVKNSAGEVKSVDANVSLLENGDNVEISVPTGYYQANSTKIVVPIETLKNEVSSLNSSFPISASVSIQHYGGGGAYPSVTITLYMDGKTYSATTGAITSVYLTDIYQSGSASVSLGTYTN